MGEVISGCSSFGKNSRVVVTEPVTMVTDLMGFSQRVLGFRALHVLGLNYDAN